MNSNLPTNSAQFIGLGQKMYTGTVQFGTAIPITMVAAAQLQTDLDAFITQEAEFNAACSARLAASEAFQGTLAPVYEWRLGVINTLAAQAALGKAEVALSTIGEAWTGAHETLVGVVRAPIKNSEGGGGVAARGGGGGDGAGGGGPGPPWWQWEQGGAVSAGGVA